MKKRKGSNVSSGDVGEWGRLIILILMVGQFGGCPVSLANGRVRARAMGTFPTSAPIFGPQKIVALLGLSCYLL